MFISRGASVFGVFWKIMRTPSTSISSIGSETKPVGRDQPDRAGGHALAEALADIAVRGGGQQQPVLVEEPAVHRVAGVDVLGNGEAP